MKTITVAWVTRYYQHCTKTIYRKDLENFKRGVERLGGLVLSIYKARGES